MKLAHFCDAFSVRTAWHGPSELAPIGAAAQMHLDLSAPNFGIQEFSGFVERQSAGAASFVESELEVFPGCPEARDGYIYLSARPGIGVGFDEKAAAKYPYTEMDFGWLFARLKDGTAVRP
jgi:mannonate dehydratase